MCTYGICDPLVYILRYDHVVPVDTSYIFEVEAYYGASGSIYEELIARLVHIGSIYKNDNISVFLKMRKSLRGASVESTVKNFDSSK